LGLGRQLRGPRCCVLREGTHAGAVHLVADCETRDRRAHPLDGSGQATAGVERFGCAQAEPGYAHEIWLAGHDVPGPSIDTGGIDPHQHLVGGDAGPGSFGQAEGGLGVDTVGVLDDGGHGVRASSRRRGTALVVDRRCVHGSLLLLLWIWAGDQPASGVPERTAFTTSVMAWAEIAAWPRSSVIAAWVPLGANRWTLLVDRWSIWSCNGSQPF